MRVVLALLIALLTFEAGATLQVNQLSGFGQKGAILATSLSVIDSTTSTGSATITAPATIEKGDLLWFFDYCRNASGGVPAGVIPPGFVAGGNLGVGASRVQLSGKLADGTEDGATITGCDGDTADNKIIVQIRAGNGQIVHRGAGSSTLGEATTGDPAEITIPAASFIPPTLGMVAFGASGTVNPRTTSITPTLDVNSSVNFYVHIYIQNSAPADYTANMEDDGVNVLLGRVFGDILVAR